MSENKKNVPVIPIIIASISLIIGFTLGLFYQKSKTPSFSQKDNQFQMGDNSKVGRNNTGNNSDQKNRGQMAGFRQTIGEIISADDKSVTVKMTDGSSKIVLISDSTVVNQSTAVSKTDLKVGAKVAVMGDQNADGSITGKTINLNPQIPSITPTAKK